MESKKIGKGLNAILDSVYKPNKKLNTFNHHNDPIFKEMNMEIIPISKTRLEIAAMAMQGLCSNSFFIESMNKLSYNSDEERELLVKTAYKLADELLKQENI
jgi:hypothetical protein